MINELLTIVRHLKSKENLTELESTLLESSEETLIVDARIKDIIQLINKLNLIKFKASPTSKAFTNPEILLDGYTYFEMRSVTVYTEDDISLGSFYVSNILKLVFGYEV